MGIFDYLTLGIPRLALKIFDAAHYLDEKGYDKSAVAVGGLGNIVNIILIGLRCLVAAAATLVVSIPVLAIHIVSNLVGLVTGTYNTALAIQNKDNVSLAYYLKNNKMSADDLRLTSIAASDTLTGRTITLALTAKKRTVRSGERQPQTESPSPETEAFVVEIDQLKLENTGAFRTIKHIQKGQIHAILAHNLFKADSRLRDENNPKFTKECDQEIVNTVLAM